MKKDKKKLLKSNSLINKLKSKKKSKEELKKLKEIKKKIKDKKLLWLTKEILLSTEGMVGLPLGNYTSQMFANIYLNELDQYVKHKLKCKYNTKKIEIMDERLTTVEAHKTMNFLDINKTKKRGIVDTISAVYILEMYMNKKSTN